MRLVVLLCVSACWRGGATPEPSTPNEPPPVHVAAHAPARDPARDADEAEAARFVEEADQAFERMDMAAAEDGYRRASTLRETRVADYARYKLGWVYFNNARMVEALEQLADVAHRARDAKLRDTAGDDAARVYANIGKAQHARSFFQRLDPNRTDRRLELLADTYDMLGKSAEAQVVTAQITGSP